MVSRQMIYFVYSDSPPLPPPPPQMDYQSEGGPVQQGQQNIYGRGMAAARREADLPEGVPFNYVEKGSGYVGRYFRLSHFSNISSHRHLRLSSRKVG